MSVLLRVSSSVAAKMRQAPPGQLVLETGTLHLPGLHLPTTLIDLPCLVEAWTDQDGVLEKTHGISQMVVVGDLSLCPDGITPPVANIRSEVYEPQRPPPAADVRRANNEIVAMLGGRRFEMIQVDESESEDEMPLAVPSAFATPPNVPKTPVPPVPVLQLTIPSKSLPKKSVPPVPSVSSVGPVSSVPLVSSASMDPALKLRAAEVARLRRTIQTKTQELQTTLNVLRQAQLRRVLQDLETQLAELTK